MKTANFIALFVAFFAFAVANPGDHLWGNCQTISILGQSKNICVDLYEDADCGAKVKLTVDYFVVFEQDLDLEVAPQVCGSYNGCNFCARLLPDDHGNTCIQVQPKCGILNLPALQFGCLTSGVLQTLQNCLANRCPNDCSGHGTCTNGTCRCAAGFFGKDCSSQAPVYENCQQVGPLDANICVRLEFLECLINVTIRLQSGPLELPVFDQTYPLNDFKKLFAQDMCALNARNCHICLHWNDLSIQPGQSVAGCGAMNVSCFNEDFGNFNIGCFVDNVVLPECFLKCDNECSGHGDCNMGKCICYSNWQGDDCSAPKGIVTTTEAATTASNITPPPTSNLPSAFVISIIVIFFIGLVTVAVVIVWFVRKQRAQKEPQFRQLEIEEDTLMDEKTPQDD